MCYSRWQLLFKCVWQWPWLCQRVSTCSSLLLLRQPRVFALRQCRRNRWDSRHAENLCCQVAYSMAAQGTETQASWSAALHVLALSSPGAKLTCGELQLVWVYLQCRRTQSLWPVPGCSGTYVQWIGESRIQCLRRGICINKVVNHKTWTQFLESSSSWRLRCFGRVVMGNHCLCWTCFMEREPQSVTFRLVCSFFGCSGFRASFLQGLGSA